MSRTWKTADINYLKRYAAGKKIEELAQRFDTDEAEIISKLIELGLSSKEGPAVASADDALLATFEGGLRALHDGEWQKAHDLLTKAAAQREMVDLAERARQYLKICHERLHADEADDEDVVLRAVYHKNRGELAAALACVQDRLAAGDESSIYLVASIYSLEERTEEAAELLERAIELNKENRVHAFHDPDFSFLRQQQEYAHLFGLS